MAKNGGWWGAAQAAVSLSFDDAATSQLEQALPVLDRYGVHATFYVNPTVGGRFEHNLEQWRAARARGHEVANHTMVHPCSGNFAFVTEERALERWRLEDIERDVLQAGERLRTLMGVDKPVSFAYPCGQTFVGEGAGRRSYVPVIAKHFAVGRGVGESANDPELCDLHCLSSWMVEGLTGTQLIQKAEPAIAAGQWAIFCFHGIGGDHIRIDTDPFAALVSYLKERERDVWTETVQTVGAHLAARRAG